MPRIEGLNDCRQNKEHVTINYKIYRPWLKKRSTNVKWNLKTASLLSTEHVYVYLLKSPKATPKPFSNDPSNIAFIGDI